MRLSRIAAMIASSMLVISCGGHSITPPAGHGGGDLAQPQVFQGGGLPRNFTRFSPDTYSTSYGGIVAGLDNSMWFLDLLGPGLVKIAMSGATTEYPLPSQYPYELQPLALAPAPGGKFFVLDCNGQTSPAVGAIEVVNTKGHGRAYQLPSSDVSGDCNTESMAAGPDGNAWFAGYRDIVRVTPNGVITQFPYPGGPNGFAFIISGPSGLLWFSDSSFSSIDSIDPSNGAITEYQFSGEASNLVAPPDGNIWFVCAGGGANCPNNTVAKMTPAGVFTYYTTPIVANGITSGGVGPGGYPYYLVHYPPYQPQLLRVNTVSGKITPIDSPYGSDTLIAMSSGPDGNIWLTASEGHIQVYILNVLKVSPTSLVFSSPQLQAGLTAKETGNPSLSASSSNTGIATVAPGHNSETFVVTSQGVGHCTITVQDAKGNSAKVSVVVQ
jgi:streptogramin lyase